MYLEGLEYVEYIPVEAYGVSTFDARIISGGNGEGNIVTQGCRFFWYYDPNDLNEMRGGFTGNGWFTEMEHTPLFNVNLEMLFEGFENQTIVNLNSYFEAWQVEVNNQGKDTDYVKDFQLAVGGNCYTTRIW